jgi:transposase
MGKSISTATRVKRTEEGTAWARVKTIGIDLSDRISHCCGIDDGGEIILEFRVPTDTAAMEKAFGGIGRKTIAIETGTHSPWVSRLLKSLGHEVIVANSRKLRFVYKNRRKDDRVDARSLARVARLDRKLLEEIRHRSEHAQIGLELLRARDVLVTTRTRLANHSIGLLMEAARRHRCPTNELTRKNQARNRRATGRRRLNCYVRSSSSRKSVSA